MFYQQLRHYAQWARLAVQTRQSRKSFRIQLFYAFVYPFSSGIVIYAGLMTYSMVVTNVTGLLPEMARDLYEGHLSTAASVFSWLVSYFLGGFVAGWCVEREKIRKWRYLHLLPLIIVSFIFAMVGLSTPRPDDLPPAVFPAFLLFSIGIQNVMVSVTTASLIKASQMTGVITELGVDIAEIFHSKGEQRRLNKREALLRLMVMISFLSGAVCSVALFPVWHTRIFFIPAAVILFVVLHDILRFGPVGLHVKEEPTLKPEKI